MFLLNKHVTIIKLFNNYGYIIIIVIVILIIAILLHNMYKSFMKSYNPIADIDLSLYIVNKHGQNLELYYNLIDKKLNKEPIT